MMAKNAPCKCDNFVPIVVPGHSSEAHLTRLAEDSAETTKELTPDEQETTKASRDRLQNLPEWSIYGKSGGTKIPIFWEWQQRSSGTTSSGPSTSESTKAEAQFVWTLSRRPKLWDVKTSESSDGIHKVAHHARQSSEISSLPTTTKFSMKKENRGAIPKEILCRKKALFLREVGEAGKETHS